MSRAQDAVAPFRRAMAGSSERVACSARPGVEFRPTADQENVTAPPPGAFPGLFLGPGIPIGGITGDGGPLRRLADVGVPSLGVTEWTARLSTVVSVTGELDVATTAQLYGALVAALRRGTQRLVCDLSGVSFLGAAGVTTLLVSRRRALACHARFDLVCPQPLPRKMITLRGLDAVFHLHDGVADAVGAQAPHIGQLGLTPTPEASNL